MKLDGIPLPIGDEDFDIESLSDGALEKLLTQEHEVIGRLKEHKLEIDHGFEGLVVEIVRLSRDVHLAIKQIHEHVDKLPVEVKFEMFKLNRDTSAISAILAFLVMDHYFDTAKRQMKRKKDV